MFQLINVRHINTLIPPNRFFSVISLESILANRKTPKTSNKELPNCSYICSLCGAENVHKTYCTLYFYCQQNIINTFFSYKKLNVDLGSII